MGMHLNAQALSSCTVLVGALRNKKADSACRAACATGGIVVVLDNTGLLLGAVGVVTCSVEHSCVCISKKSDISEIGAADDADGSMESETLKEN